MKGRNLEPRLLYPTRLSFRCKEENKSFKSKRIQQHQTRFTTNSKGTYLDRKHKRKKEPQNKQTNKQTQNNEINDNRIILINNNLTCKWIKCSEQKTQIH